MLAKYPKEVKLVFKNFPLRNHKFARKAAMAVLAAEDKGKFWQFHDLLFKNVSKINDKKIKEIALELGFDEKEFEQAMKAPAILTQINQDLRDGKKAGVRGTPTIFINGRRLNKRSLQGFSAVIDKELKKIKKAGG